LNWKSTVSDFTMNTKDHKIMFHDNVCDDFKITFAETGLSSLTGERVRKVKKYINGDDFMVTYGDGVGDINIRELVEFHKAQKTLGTITGVKPTTRFGLIDINPKTKKVEKFFQHAVTDFDHGRAPNPSYINGGFMVFKKKALDLIPENGMIEALFPVLAEKRELSIYTHLGKWKCMDTHKEVEEMNRHWVENPFWKIWKN